MSYYVPNDPDPETSKILIGASLTVMFLTLMWLISGGFV